MLGEARRDRGAARRWRGSSPTRSRWCATTRGAPFDALAPRPCPVDLDRPTPEIVAAVRACVPAAFPEPVPAARRRSRDPHDNDDSTNDED